MRLSDANAYIGKKTKEIKKKQTPPATAKQKGTPGKRSVSFLGVVDAGLGRLLRIPIDQVCILSTL